MAELPKELVPKGSSHVPHPSSSSTSLSKSASTVRSKARPSNIKTVVTAPPWARDEPPSPTTPKDDGLLGASITRRPSERRPSDATAHSSSSGGPSEPESRWFSFAPRPPAAPAGPSAQPAQQEEEKDAPPRSPPKSFRGFALRERSLSWLNTSRLSGYAGEDGGGLTPVARGKMPDIRLTPTIEGQVSTSNGGPAHLHVDVPPVPENLSTLRQTQTPGWSTPWTPRLAHAGARADYMNLGRDSGEYQDEREETDPPDEKGTVWSRRRRKARTFVLKNVYAPLLFRFVNITFTTAALAMAIRIRNAEIRNHVQGAVGCSPTLVIIFAPLTLVHVMIAIYLEYFGRPLGLWRTSHKLAHTLSEVLFICAWSAALALAFDNFFTSSIPCANTRAISWYNSLPRPPSIGSELGGGTGEQICDFQLVLIVLVGVGLIMYCTNLVISLFRIFERIKYHAPDPSWGR